MLLCYRQPVFELQMFTWQHYDFKRGVYTNLLIILGEEVCYG